MTDYYADMSESAALNYLAGTSNFGDAGAIRRIAAIMATSTGSGTPEAAVTATVGSLYVDTTGGALYIKATGTGNTGWLQLESASSGSGDVVGPGSATDNAIPRFDGTGGKTIQGSAVVVDDSGNVSGVGTLASGAITSSGAIVSDSTTDASSTVTGSIQTDGGLGVAKAAYIGTTLNVAGASTVAAVTASGNLSVAKSGATITADATSGSATVAVDGSAATNRLVSFQTDTSARWKIGANPTAESGSDAGSNFVIYRYDDSGVLTATAVSINRSTGKVTIAGDFNISGTTAATSTTTGSLQTGGGLGVVGDTYLGGNVSVAGVADTATAATHYYVETGTDGMVRPKTLANVKTEIVTTAAVNSAAATTVGTVTSGTWNAGAVTSSGAIVSDSTTDSTSTTTGSIQTDGGIGVAKSGWFGEEVNHKSFGFAAIMTTDQTLATGTTFETLLFDTESDPQAALNTGTGVWTCPVTGLWQFSGYAEFSANSTGVRSLRALASSSVTPICFTTTGAVTGYTTKMGVTGVISLTAGDTVEFGAWQTSGGDLDVLNARFGGAYIGRAS